MRYNPISTQEVWDIVCIGCKHQKEIGGCSKGLTEGCHKLNYYCEKCNKLIGFKTCSCGGEACICFALKDKFGKYNECDNCKVKFICWSSKCIE